MNWTDNSGNISSYESVRNAYYPFNTTRFNTLYASSLFTELIHHNLIINSFSLFFKIFEISFFHGKNILSVFKIIFLFKNIVA